MGIEVTTRDEATIVEISGNLDANTTPQAQEQIMPLIVPNCILVLDMSKCEYVSSAGLRLLLTVAKRVKATEGGQWCLASVSAEIMDVMEMTGFAKFFKTFDTVSEAIEATRRSV
jgi:anti-sigma B factor antagonist